MSAIIEDVLDELEVSWREFCQDPYETISLIKSQKAFYSTTKSGYFVFDRNIIEQCLFDGVLFAKRLSVDAPNHPQIREFFSKWLFFREDDMSRELKKQIFRSINRSNRSNISIPTEEWRECSRNQLFLSVRKSLFYYIVNIFFICDDFDISKIYEESENIYGYIQGGLDFDEADVIDSIVSFADLFGKNKRYEFDREEYDGAILNCIIDGYEPLNDLVWNTVNILLAQPRLLNEFVAYQIALHSTPSFRYVVRYATKDIHIGSYRISEGDKLFCFLSPRVRLGTLSGERNMAFGAGRHVCVGRQIAEALVPNVALSIVKLLQEKGINKVELRRSASLGAEGVYRVDFPAM